MFKVCTKCKNELEITMFSKDNKTKDKLCKQCKICQKEYREKNKEKISNDYKKYREKNREKLIEYNRKYYKNNTNKCRELSKRYKENNKEYYIIYGRQYHMENKEKLNEYSRNKWNINKDEINKKRRENYVYTEEMKKRDRIYYRKNLERIKIKNKNYYEENKDKCRELKAKWRKENIDRYRKYCREYYNKTKFIRKEKIKIQWNNRRVLVKNCEGNYTIEQWEKCLEFFEYKCAYSGKELADKETIDHIIPLSKSGTNYIWNLCPCSGSCNSSKRNFELEDWYRKQEYFSQERLNKIYKWIEYAKTI